MDIVTRQPVTVVGLPVRAHWKALFVEVPRAWNQLFARRQEIEHRTDSLFVDVSLAVEDDEYLELVGAVVSHVDQIPDGMWAVEVEGGEYVFHRHEGSVTGIADAFGDMYRWAEESGHAAGEFKLDLGYTTSGQEETHDLFIAVGTEKRWKPVRPAEESIT